MNNWELRALKEFEKSIRPIPSERNEIDWKSNLSNKSERLAMHLSAFSNYNDGGFLAFGVDNNGNINGIKTTECEYIIQQLGNIARNNLEPAITIEHSILEFEKQSILFVYIKEAHDKPVYLRGKTIYDSYTRSGGQTVKMTKNEVKLLISKSLKIKYEIQLAQEQLTNDEVLNMLDYDSYFQLTKRTLPNTKTGILDVLASEDFILKNVEKWGITHLGALLFARNINNFKTLQRKAVRVIQYNDNTRLHAKKEQIGIKGYASGFEGMVTFVLNLLPENELINDALRVTKKMYPDVALREFIANAIIHQDFETTGTSVLIEIFADRIEITNPGRPLIDTMRFIDSAPKSRNETLASLLRRLGICEERGSGIDRAITSIELFQLPAPKFISGYDFTRVIIYAYQALSQMDKDDKIRACYQHCCLKYVNNQEMNNQSLRTRFNISEKNYPMASRIITDTLESGLIKSADSNNSSKKYATYIPIWA